MGFGSLVSRCPERGPLFENTIEIHIDRKRHMTTSKGRTKTSTKLKDRITELAIMTRWSAAEINRYIRQDETLSGEVIPDTRTIERRVREARAPEDDQPEWSMENFSGEDARLIFDVLDARLQELNTPVRKFSHETAKWIVRIREVAPELDPSACYLIARLYMVRSRSKANTEDLEMYLAIGPWKDEARFTRYIKAVEMGLFPPMPIWHRLVEALAPRATTRMHDNTNFP